MNVLWGFFNIVVGYVLTCRVGEFGLRVTADVMVCGLGILSMGLLHVHFFGPLHCGQKPGRS